MKRDTGSVSRSLPSSISIRMATPVIGFDIDAIRKMASFRIGVFASRSIKPCASKCATLPRRDTIVIAPVICAAIDVALDHLVDPLEALRRQADGFGLVGWQRRRGERGCKNEAHQADAQLDLHARELIVHVNGRRTPSTPVNSVKPKFSPASTRLVFVTDVACRKNGEVMTPL